MKGESMGEAIDEEGAAGLKLNHPAGGKRAAVRVVLYPRNCWRNSPESAALQFLVDHLADGIK